LTKILAGILGELPAKKGGEVLDWLRPSRGGRALLIDGPRGVGKTSLMLTALREWSVKDAESARASESKGAEDDPASKSKSKAEALEVTTREIVKVRGRVRVLSKPLDFDPLPLGMPLHAWLLQPWRAFLDRENLWKECDQLEDKWWELHESALAGWAQGKSPSHIELGDQARGWFEIQERWGKFVDEVLRALRESRDSEAQQKLLIVPIDDLDMQVGRLVDLLHAMRLFAHPNVVYVLTGDYEHMSQVLRLFHEQQHEEIKKHGSQAPGVPEKVREMAQSNLDKAFPDAARISLEPISLSRFWSDRRLFDRLGPGWERRSLADIAEALDSDTKRALDGIRTASAALGSVDLCPTRRDVQLAIDKLALQPKLPSPKTREGFVEAILHASGLAPFCSLHDASGKPRINVQSSIRYAELPQSKFSFGEDRDLEILLEDAPFGRPPKTEIAPFFFHQGLNPGQVVLSRLLEDAEFAAAPSVSWIYDTDFASIQPARGATGQPLLLQLLRGEPSLSDLARSRPAMGAFANRLAARGPNLGRYLFVDWVCFNLALLTVQVAGRQKLEAPWREGLAKLGVACTDDGGAKVDPATEEPADPKELATVLRAALKDEDSWLQQMLAVHGTSLPDFCSWLMGTMRLLGPWCYPTPATDRGRDRAAAVEGMRAMLDLWPASALKAELSNGFDKLLPELRWDLSRAERHPYWEVFSPGKRSEHWAELHEKGREARADAGVVTDAVPPTTDEPPK
jgi:hypothetical protein